MNDMPTTTETTARMTTIDVDGLNIFYREVGKPGKSTISLHPFFG